MIAELTATPARPRTVDSILLVEDEPISRELLAKILRIKFPGRAVFTAENGQAGLELFRSRLPAIVLTDIRMPVMDGTALGREIRRLCPQTGIIALTAHSNMEGIMEGQERIFNRMVFKPVKIQDLQDAIESCSPPAPETNS